MTLKKYAEIYSHEHHKEQERIYSRGHNPLFYWKQIWQIIGTLTGNEKEAGRQACQAQAGGLVCARPWGPPSMACLAPARGELPRGKGRRARVFEAARTGPRPPMKHSNPKCCTSYLYYVIKLVSTKIS